jgi:hypothetical protein
VAALQWPAMHPLDDDWSWIDATGWCRDIGDVLSAFTTPGDVHLSGGDGNMSLLTTVKSTDNDQAGIRLLGGTPGVSYTITAILNGSLGYDTKSVDIALPCQGDLPEGLSTPWLADFSNLNNSSAYECSASWTPAR